MKRWILACMMAAFAVGLAAPVAGQTSSTLPVIINWKVVPGALHWHGSELAVTVGCQVLQRVNWSEDPLNPRNSLLTMHLKIRSKRKGHNSDFWNSRRGGLDPWSRPPRPIAEGPKCDLSKGIDTVTFVLTGLANTSRSFVPSALADWRIVVRYYKPREYAPHTGFSNPANGIDYEISDNSFLDHINNYAVSPAVAAEEWYEERQ